MLDEDVDSPATFRCNSRQDKGIAEVIIGKQRNGPIGRVNLRFGGEFTRFDNLAPSYGGGTPF